MTITNEKHYPLDQTIVHGTCNIIHWGLFKIGVPQKGKKLQDFVGYFLQVTST